MQRCRIAAAIMYIFLRLCNSDLHWNRKHDIPDKDAHQRERRRPSRRSARAAKQKQQQQQRMTTTTPISGSMETHCRVITSKSATTIKRTYNCNNTTALLRYIILVVVIALMVRQGDETSAIAVNSDMNAVVVVASPQRNTIASLKKRASVLEEERKKRNGEDAASHRNHPRFNNDRRNATTNALFRNPLLHGEDSTQLIGSRPPPSSSQTFHHSRLGNSFNALPLAARRPFHRLRRSGGRRKRRRRRRLRKSISNAVIETANCEHVELIDCDEYEPNDEMRCMITATGMPCCVCSGKLKRRARHWTTIF